MMYRCMTATAMVRMGRNIKQDICIEYLTTYLRGEVAGGDAGGGNDTIGFLLEKEGGYRLLALLIDKVRGVSCFVVNGTTDVGIDGLINWAEYGFLVMMYQWVHDGGNGENGKQ